MFIRLFYMNGNENIQGKITIDDYFKREVDLLFQRYEISEVHRIEIKTT